MMGFVRPTFSWFVAASLLVGCAINLAPDYDRALVTGLTTANAGMMELFASASSGTDAASFKERERTYNHLIGTLDALALQARARPMPRNDAPAAVRKILDARGGEVVEVVDVAPSTTAIERISKTLVVMRDVDRKQGVTATEVAAFRSQAAIYMDQALTYESALER